ncbi:MAG TPA: sugar transferase [Jatrophihabitans sp.]|nr:sugar transferase [Jatrophihabitans sp.]
MFSGGRQAADEGVRIRAGSYPDLVRTSSSANGLITESSRPPDVATRAERVLVAVPAGERAPVESGPASTKRAKWIIRRLVGLAFIDFAAATAAAVVAYGVDSGAAPWAVVADPSVLALPAAWLALVALNDGYDREIPSGHEEVVRLFRAFLHAAALVAITSYASHVYLARDFLLVALPLVLTLNICGRFVARSWLRGRRALKHPVRTVLAVGEASAVTDFAEAVLRDRSADIVVRGACLVDDFPAEQRALAAVGVPTVGDIDSVVESAHAIGAETIAVVSTSQLGSDRLRWIAWQLEGTEIDLLVSPGLVEIARHRLRVRSVAWMPLLRVEQPEFRGVRRVLKEVMDRMIAVFATLMLLPLFTAIFLIVRLSSPGPAIFRQTRVGRDGRTFEMLKFRSMYVDAESRLAELESENVHAAGPLFKVHNDPRVTRVGRILRRYSLDELPQLFNVVAGHMSLVGPRPPLPAEVLEYEADARRRLLVKPGMTGLWQVSGRSDLNWAESVRLDLRYVENWTPALDLMILWKTASAVLRGSGAY